MKLVWRGRAVSAAVKAAAADGLLEGAEMILDASNQRAPIDEGALVNSGQTSVDGLTAAISYDTKYAVRQHEDTTLRHLNGRQAKFLESAFSENVNAALAHVSDKIRDAILDWN